MKTILVKFIRVYQLLISPLLGCRCRFLPSCSQYSIDAISEYGALKGSFLTLKRLLKCHPFHPGGLDPVIKRETKHPNNRVKSLSKQEKIING